MLHLILGGQRSGKSAFAESIAMHHASTVVYVATAQILDSSIQDRVQRHRQRRPSSWKLHEEPTRLAMVLSQYGRHHCIIIDCLNMWLVNFFEQQRLNTQYQTEKEMFLRELENIESDVLVVSMESSMGVVPASVMSQRFIDELGMLNQDVAAISNRVSLVVAGIPMNVKGS